MRTEYRSLSCGSLLCCVLTLAMLTGRASGPGLLCRALGVDRRLNGADLLGDTLCITDPDPVEFRIVKRPRIGVDYAGAWARRLLRFYIRGNASVSHP